MRHSLLLPTTALAAALVLGCGEQPSPAEPASTPRPSLRTDQNPDGPGAVVIRGPAEGAFLIADPDPAPGLTVLAGNTFAELEQFCATGEVTLGPLEDLFVIRPDGSVHNILRGAKVPLLVWETAIPFIDPIAELCGELLGLPHLTGTGQFIARDNDVFVSGDRANAFGLSIHGQVTSEAGERFRFKANFHAVILRSGEEHITSDFRLDPFGP
jgi:hypothetical protein